MYTTARLSHASSSLTAELFLHSPPSAVYYALLKHNFGVYEFFLLKVGGWQIKKETLSIFQKFLRQQRPPGFLFGEIQIEIEVLEGH